MLTGQLVFNAGKPIQIAIAHAKQEPVPPSEVSEEPIPAALEAVIMRLLAKDPNDRPQSALALIDELDGCAGIEPWTPSAAEKWWGMHAPELARAS